MAIPQPLAEAGISLERDAGRLIVRDSNEQLCPIRNRGGEALAGFLAKNPDIQVLDLRDSKISDNGLAQICLALRQSNQLVELHANAVGHMGLKFLLGLLQRCGRLHSLSVEVCDVPTLFLGRQNLSAADYDTSDYVTSGTQEEEEEELEEDELQARAAKAEKLRRVFTENSYDSGDEAAPVEVKAESDVLTKLLSELVSIVRSQVNLIHVDCRGDAVPNHVKLDIQRAAEEHQALPQGERGARSGSEVLQDEMKEIQSILEGKESSIDGILPGEELRSTNMGIRSYIGRRLHSALGEALYECQRFKSKGNKALASPQDEIAFIAMYLRKKMEAEKS